MFPKGTKIVDVKAIHSQREDADPEMDDVSVTSLLIDLKGSG